MVVWPAEAKAANQTLDASGQAQLLHAWRATWVCMGERGKGWTLGSCCRAGAVLLSPSLGIWSRGIRSPCMPVIVWLELA